MRALTTVDFVPATTVYSKGLDTQTPAATETTRCTTDPMLDTTTIAKQSSAINVALSRGMGPKALHPLKESNQVARNHRPWPPVAHQSPHPKTY